MARERHTERQTDRQSETERERQKHSNRDRDTDLVERERGEKLAISNDFITRRLIFCL